MKLLLVTSNRHKLREFERLFAGQVCLLSLADVGLSGLAIEETGASFEANARLKVAAVRPHVAPDLGIIADDSGLEVDALDGAPGIYSARYSGEGASDDANNRKLLAVLQAVPAEKRQARYVCALAYQFYGDDPIACMFGTCEGEILSALRGAGGFGYDPLFYLPKFSKSMAEMSPSLKDELSHRGRACRALLAVIRRREAGV